MARSNEAVEVDEGEEQNYEAKLREFNRIFDRTSEPYSSLGLYFFERYWNRMADILPVFAMGHPDEEVRQLARALFSKLYLKSTDS